MDKLLAEGQDKQTSESNDEELNLKSVMVQLLLTFNNPALVQRSLSVLFGLTSCTPNIVKTLIHVQLLTTEQMDDYKMIREKRHDMVMLVRGLPLPGTTVALTSAILSVRSISLPHGDSQLCKQATRKITAGVK